jgi:hypothetical protein
MRIAISRTRLLQLGAAAAMLLIAGAAVAHGVAADDQAYIEQTSGPQIGPFLYLGAKHMVTGYDHLLFLTGIIFFLYRLKHVAAYVTLFAIGHSTTLLAGVLLGRSSACRWSTRRWTMCAPSSAGSGSGPMPRRRS